MTTRQVGAHVTWAMSDDGTQYSLILAQHELDIITDALWEYHQRQRGVHPRTADLANAIRRILQRAVVAVHWDAARVEAIPALPPEST
jgi:hypothetical protein